MMKADEGYQNTLRIRRASRRFIRLLQALMIAVALADAAFWLFVNDLVVSTQRDMLPAYARLPLPASARFLGFCVTLLPLGLFVYGNAVLIRLFRLYEQGRFFTQANVWCFKRLSRVLMAWCLAGILSHSLMSLALTFHHPEGQRTLSIGLGSPDLTALLIGGILAVIAWVMDEARQINEENELTI